jgi:hypothetical protein
MTLHPGVRQVLAALVVVLLLALAFQGIAGGVDQFPDSFTWAQYLQSGAQVLYGVCALFCIVTAIRWRRFARPVQVGFVASFVVAAGLATVSWGEQSYWSGFISAVAALVVASLLIWAVRAALIPLIKREL